MNKTMKILGIGAAVLLIILIIVPASTADYTWGEMRKDWDEAKATNPDARWCFKTTCYIIWHNPDGKTAYIEIWDFDKVQIFHGLMRIDKARSVLP
jgi:hypothetical protein